MVLEFSNTIKESLAWVYSNQHETIYITKPNQTLGISAICSILNASAAVFFGTPWPFPGGSKRTDAVNGRCFRRPCERRNAAEGLWGEHLMWRCHERCDSNCGMWNLGSRLTKKTSMICENGRDSMILPHGRKDYVLCCEPRKPDLQTSRWKVWEDKAFWNF